MSEPIELMVEYLDNSSEKLCLSSVGPNLYRLETNSVCCRYHYGDVIEVEPIDSASVRLRRRVSKSKLKTSTFVVSLDATASPQFQRLLVRIVGSGGHWELVFGGVLIVNLPKSSDLDIARELGLV